MIDTVLHYLGTLVSILFVAAVLYSLTKAYRKRKKKQEAEAAIRSYKHVKVKNLHQYDLPPIKGYVKYPVDTSRYVRRFPQNFMAISLETANDQPYSICLIGFAEFEKGELVNRHYYYVQPPENKFTRTAEHGVTWDTVKAAYEFGEYWNAGMKDYFIGHTLVAHNAPYVIGCIEHALKVFGIEPPQFKYIDTLEIAKQLYSFPSNQLETVCQETGIEVEMHNSLHEAAATAQFLQLAHKDYPMDIPRVYVTNGEVQEEEILAGAIATIEREEALPEAMFDPWPADPTLLQKLLDKQYIEPGKKTGCYYATDAGLDFMESLK